MAQAPIVMLHDADILVPLNYIEVAVKQFEIGCDAIRPLRFLFYLSRKATGFLHDNLQILPRMEVEAIAQNSQGGSTLVRKEVYWKIGGHDESFRGWGGEDLEFLERLKTQKLFRGGMFPALHLWHRPAEKKSSGHRNQELLTNLKKQTPGVRINNLTKTIMESAHNCPMDRN
jgi:hypothetical protein